jgi:hypothetical protein
MLRLSGPSSTRATSASVTTEPSGAAFSTMALNSSTVCSLVRAVMGALSICPPTAGRAPSWPAETCAFWALSAATMSEGIRAKRSRRAGSIQMRMA